MKPFNKPRLQNLGIEVAGGDVLSFLDADAIVGSAWVAAANLLTISPELTKVCYRVRYLDPELLGHLQRAQDRDTLVQAWFDEYSAYPLAFEGYGEAHINLADTTAREPVFGNSQFSIRRSVLGHLRFNEEYEGRGFEDVWMNQEIARRYGAKYRATMEINPAWALFHIRQPSGGEEGWGADEFNKASFKRYFAS